LPKWWGGAIGAMHTVGSGKDQKKKLFRAGSKKKRNRKIARISVGSHIFDNAICELFSRGENVQKG